MDFRPLLLWYAFLGGPVAWAVHIAARYPLVPTACKAGAVWILHVITAACLAVSVGAALSAVRVSRAVAPEAATAPRPPASRVRYMAWTGLGFSVLFGTAILLELLPALLQDPCADVRRSSWTGAEPG